MDRFLILVSPAFAAFEVAQLLVAQRYIGIEQIRGNRHPLDAAVAAPGWLGTAWLGGLIIDYFYQFALLFQPELGVKFAAALLVMVSAFGFALRRVCGLRWGLVVLTPECGARAGFFMFIFNMMVLHANDHMYGLEWLYRHY
ncbi:MAG TPA: hypothetical protein VHC95_02600 [Opitutales bacterium]|nr:hypothetical protein [Opitutales bacterium]